MEEREVFSVCADGHRYVLADDLLLKDAPSICECGKKIVCVEIVHDYGAVIDGPPVRDTFFLVAG